MMAPHSPFRPLMIFALLVATLIPAVALAATHSSTPICAARAELAAWLTRQYGEEQLFTGSAGDHLVYEVWTSLNGTWSVLQTRPDGTACLVVAGRDGTWIVQGLDL